MNNSTKVSLVVVVAIVVVGFLMWSAGHNDRGSAPTSTANQPQQTQTQAVSAPVSTSASTTVVATAKSQTKPVVSKPTYTNKPVPSVNNYANYVNQYYSNQSTCSEAASGQYKSLYAGTLMSSSFQPYYNPSSGACYVKVTGGFRAPYATTTIQVAYFRNVGTNSIIAQCSDAPGTAYLSDNAVCTNKLDGRTITLREFNTMIGNYSVQH